MIVKEDVGSRLLGGIALNLGVGEPVVRKIQFIRNTRVKGMRLNESKVVIIDRVRKGNVATARQQAAPAKFVEESTPGYVRCKTEAVRIAEVVIHASVVAVCGGGLRVRKRKAPNLPRTPRGGIDTSVVIRLPRPTCCGLVAWAFKIRSRGRVPVR